ncbi:hypothetical protein [Paraburkholderia sp. RAU2J]|uniref:hypothetical protein n=1 Tax=Paraburkholderia sp. RAU2J TaxID=1938810 RepID=UPI0011C3930A|nr:hypothetical protein [Paraburkholderia sp. RAU2J]
MNQLGHDVVALRPPAYQLTAPLLAMRIGKLIRASTVDSKLPHRGRPEDRLPLASSFQPFPYCPIAGTIVRAPFNKLVPKFGTNNHPLRAVN